MLSRFHLIPERNGRTDRHTDRRTDLLYQYRASVCWRAIKTKVLRSAGKYAIHGNDTNYVSAVSDSDVGDQYICSLRSWQIFSMSLIFHCSPQTNDSQPINVFLCLPLAVLPSTISQSPQRVIADVIGDSSLILRFFFIFELSKNKVIFAHKNVISNWLTYLVHAMMQN